MQIDLRLILDLHDKWLRGANGGQRADLRGADLRGADLRRANLCEANLRRANLCEANLCDVNLCEVNLRGADLRGADLCGANLCGADLRGANLDFAVWPLHCGSFRVKAGKRLFAQLLKHVAMLDVSEAGAEVREAMTTLRKMEAASWFDQFRPDLAETPKE